MWRLFVCCCLLGVSINGSLDVDSLVQVSYVFLTWICLLFNLCIAAPSFIVHITPVLNQNSKFKAGLQGVFWEHSLVVSVFHCSPCLLQSWQHCVLFLQVGLISQLLSVVCKYTALPLFFNITERCSDVAEQRPRRSSVSTYLHAVRLEFFYLGSWSYFRFCVRKTQCLFSMY